MTEYTQQLMVETHGEKKHPNYLAIFGLLALITLVEVTVASSWPAVLIILSLTKVALVAMYYMHLKFASGWFTTIFLVPVPFLLLVLIVIVVALTPAADGVVAATGVCSFF